MARQTGADVVRGAIEPVVNAAGLYLEDVVVTRAGSRSVVRVVIDLPEDRLGSLDMDALADVSREISTALDADDAVAGAYTLEVSTPGTSRPLTSTRHFRRARTRLVRLALRDGTSLMGRLLDVDDALHLDDGAGVRSVPLADVVSGCVEVELTRATDDADDVDDSDMNDEEDS